MSTRPPFWALLGLAIPCATAGGQGVVVLKAPEGELGLFAGNETRTSGAASPSSVRSLRGWLYLSLAGHVQRPELLQFEFAARPLLERLSYPESATDGRTANITLSGSARVLSAAPASLSLSGLSGSGTTLDYAGRERLTSGNQWRADLRLRVPGIPTRITFRDQSTRTDWIRGTDTSVVADLDLRIAGLEAKNSKTRVLLERWDRTDRLYGTAFSENRVFLDHSLGWGTGSRLRSSARYISRAGSTSRENLQITERVGLHHSTVVQSEYSFSYVRAALETVRNATTAATADVHVLPSRSIALGANATWQHTSGPALRGDLYSTLASAGFTSSPASRLRFRLGGQFGFRAISQEVEEAGWRAVIDESHIVGIIPRIVLSQPDADPTSIAVTDGDGASVYREGIDYEVVVIGRTAQLNILQGSRIEVDQEVLVSYRFRVMPAGSDRAAGGGIDGSVEFGSASAYARYSSWGQPGAVAGETALLHRGEALLGLRFDRLVPAGNLSVALEYNRLDYAGPATERVLASVRYGSPLFAGLRMSVVGSGERQSAADRTVFLYSLRSGVQWQVWRKVRALADVSAWRRDLVGIDQRYFLGWSLGIEAPIRLLQMEARYYRRYNEDGRSLLHDNLVVRAIRRF